ncbi:vacuolar cation/proton exchanger 1a [Iris pallida]|uniref:Vacuolar cation/proton exchanger 1a n=1 Tax=Iris pallida TaxID=29817 RepID=A0AAX6EFS7_IRIPA|nr:vacuolar cation/proton exchanger 1a [Iris pallida]KAJ6820809.1 vacuolar cation/proton exchanger 1a [Iris pallida]
MMSSALWLAPYLSNLLLVLGTSFFYDGLANLHKEQLYDRVSYLNEKKNCLHYPNPNILSNPFVCLVFCRSKPMLIRVSYFWVFYVICLP